MFFSFADVIRKKREVIEIVRMSVSALALTANAFMAVIAIKRKNFIMNRAFIDIRIKSIVIVCFVKVEVGTKGNSVVISALTFNDKEVIVSCQRGKIFSAGGT